LFYVAITRAKDTLILSSVTALPLVTAHNAGIPPGPIYKRGGETYTRLVASPFLTELGPTAPPAIAGADWRAQLAF
jgi:hypothetical protein